jgi:hypothetical protein
VAEAEQAALGWMYLTVEGIDIESEPDLERYLRALDAFGEVAGGGSADTAVLLPALRSASAARPPRRVPAVRMPARGSRCCTPA